MRFLRKAAFGLASTAICLVGCTSEPSPSVATSVTGDEANQPETDLSTAKPDTVKPETVKPDAVRPDTVRPDTAKPDAVKPDTALEVLTPPIDRDPRPKLETATFALG